MGLKYHSGPLSLISCQILICQWKNLPLFKIVVRALDYLFLQDFLSGIPLRWV